MGVKIQINEKAILKKMQSAAVKKARSKPYLIKCPHCGFQQLAFAGSFPCAKCGKQIDFEIK